MSPFEEMYMLFKQIKTGIDTINTSDYELFELEDMEQLATKSAELSKLAQQVAEQLRSEQ